MTKKKTSQIDYLAGYVPASFNPDITTSQIAQIPPYPDSGVSFAQYAKEFKGSSYILKKQITRFYTGAFSNKASPTTETITRANKGTTTFYAAGILVQYKIDGASLNYYVDLSDGNASNFRFRVFLFGDNGSTSANKLGNVYIDLKNCPRRFDDDIKVLINGGLSTSEYLHIELFGWDEDK